MTHETRSWRESVAAFLHPRVITMLFMGLAAGLPLLLIFSSLSLWLREAGIERATVTFFSWAALGYSFKFVWAPLVDRLRLPLLTRWLGQRRGWMMLSQIGIIGAIMWMAMTDPALGGDVLYRMAFAAVLLGFSSATQDIVIDAYRIESADSNLQALMSSTYIAGYRVGMLVSGAGALYLASYFGSEMDQYDYQAWQLTYAVMAAVMLIGVVTTLVVAEPQVDRSELVQAGTSDIIGIVVLFFILVGTLVSAYLVSGFMLLVGAGLSFLLVRSGLINQQVAVTTFVEPVREFFRRHGLQAALWILALIGLYRISDIVLGVIANVFYQDLDFSKNEIATVVKTFGLFMTIAGGFLGGILSLRYGVMRMLLVGAALTIVTNLSFALLASVGKHELLFYLVISADNLTGGLASAAFVAFLSSLTNVRFTAVQYAIFSSLMTLIPKLIGGTSGTLVDQFGYVNFFVFASLIGLPVIYLVLRAGRYLDVSATNNQTQPNASSD